MKKADIVIKGSKDGLTFYLDSQCDFSDLVIAIEQKLASADCFLVGAHVNVDVGLRKLTEEQIERLRILFPSYGLILRGITSWSDSEGNNDEGEGAIMKGNRERIYQIANHLYESSERPEPAGESRNLESKESIVSFVPAAMEAPPSSLSTAATDDGAENEAPIITLGGDEQTLLIQRTLRSGQTVRYPGNVVILGDVNPGAEVIAGGNIIVMGVFRGVAHAGALGSLDAVVTAYRLRPTQLRIANHITRPPDEDDDGPDHPEIGRIRDGMVTIERYHYGSKSFGKDA
ncbi:septum site-determining protein MinC [Heliobacterium chlorum]|uniref:Probable septum site-determining protein MinC n=1 Tax=Heliobacterium chlorum TaxID=2698 RepID=A0ABR7SZE0_HELCL|nr:septum site-determining protein MinC [Heliobacterium chlorum]MBC9783903.1 septum site-determining protein MinC [Heliobacterium chlorum]